MFRFIVSPNLLTSNVFCSPRSSLSLVKKRSFCIIKNQQPEYAPFGRFVDSIQRPYDPGQLFIHRLFAYRGVILWSTNCKVATRGGNENTERETQLYQVLIDRDDWDEMNFDADLTTCLHSTGNGEQKNMTSYNGMDFCAHEDVLPYKAILDSTSKKRDPEKEMPIKNEYFNQFFKPNRSSIEGLLLNENLQQYLSNNILWGPVAIYKQFSAPFEVQVLPFYLGFNAEKGGNNHYWRCLFQIWNRSESSFSLKGQNLNVMSMISQQIISDGTMREKRMTSRNKKPATQFSAHLKLPCKKGWTLWGSFSAIDENGNLHKIDIPTIPLEVRTGETMEQTENGR